MRKAKKILALTVAAAFVVGSLTACGSKNESKKSASDTTLNVGAILVGDETEGYTLAHMDGMEAAAEKLAEEGIDVNLSYKKKVPESDEVGTNAKDLIADGCTLIVTNSYGHQFHVDDVVSAYPDVNFVCMTGDTAAGSGYDNLSNAFTKVYESRYVSGVIAGMKLQELIDNGEVSKTATPDAYDADGKIKIGYIGAFNYAEVVSGYTAFFLGIQSVVPDVAMTVKYTNSWFSEEREAAVAEYLMDQGCVIIGQHADSTGGPAAVENRKKDNKDLVCYCVGYNVSMLDVAPNSILTSASNVWEVYYETLFRQAAKGEDIATDWAEGYNEGAVCVTELNDSLVAAGTADKVAELEKALAEGTLKVFDCSKFTVGGKNITSYDQSYGFEGNECVVVDGDVTYFDESALRSAPYFDIRIDGITELDSDYDAE